MRKPIKTISTELTKFIPSKHADDSSLSENAAKISDRPMVFMLKKLTREHKYNIQGIIDTKKANTDSGFTISNVGSVLRYVWENAVDEVRNVLTDKGEFESLRGDKKNALFDSTGIDDEISEAVKKAQDISYLDEEEVKN